METTSAVVLARHNEGIAVALECLSLGGVWVVGAVTVAPSERVRLLLEIDKTRLDVEGEVVRVERVSVVADRIAISFRNLSVEARLAIFGLVEARWMA